MIRPGLPRPRLPRPGLPEEPSILPQLPQDFVLKNGILLEDFSEAINHWSYNSTGSRGTISINTDPKYIRSGTQSIKMHMVDGYLGFYGTLPLASQMRMPNGIIHVWVYIDCEVSDFSYLELSLGSGVSKWATFNICGGRPIPCGLARPTKGWNHFVIYRNEYASVSGGDSWDNISTTIKISGYGSAGKTWDIYVDSVYINTANIPQLLIQFDDSYSNADATNYLLSKGIKATVNCITSGIGTAGHLTVSDMQSLYQKGWAFGNHTKDHVQLSTVSADVAKFQIAAGRDWLLSQGFTRAADHLAMPIDVWITDTIRDAALRSGCLTVRGSAEGLHLPPVPDLYNIQVHAIQEPRTLAEARAFIDQCIKYGASLFLVFHQITPTPTPGSVSWYTDRFNALMDYIAAYGIKCSTIDEWYKGLRDPRYSSLPVGR
jgi:hypothetical protein